MSGGPFQTHTCYEKLPLLNPLLSMIIMYVHNEHYIAITRSLLTVLYSKLLQSLGKQCGYTITIIIMKYSHIRHKALGLFEGSI